jgi:BioD-like phosphotransacetylase family protein
VRLARIGSSEAASADAETFAAYLFASTTGRPELDLGMPGEGELVVAEAEAGAAPASGQAVLVVRGELTAADADLGRALGSRLIGSIATDVAPGAVESVAGALNNAGLRPITLIPEDRALAAPSIGEIRETLGAGVLYEGEDDLAVVEDVLVAPVYADPAQPHFRRFESKAVLAPFNKTDLLLAAIETEAACLVITGAGQPSPYVLDRAQHGTTTVLTSGRETPQTLAALGDVWLTSRFRGERKAAAVLAQLESRVDFANLALKLQG